jgi:nucleotide-binding universal stress UspA family protein
VAIAEEIGATMIVLGVHERTGLSRMVPAGVAARVINEAECPVETVRT